MMGLLGDSEVRHIESHGGASAPSYSGLVGSVVHNVGKFLPSELK